MVDYKELKRARLDNIIGKDTILQVEHCNAAGAKYVISGILVAGNVLSTDPVAAPILVGVGNMLRIEVAADTYVAFADENTDPVVANPVTANTTPGLKLVPGIWYVASTGQFMRSSGAMTRIEVVIK